MRLLITVLITLAAMPAGAEDAQPVDRDGEGGPLGWWYEGKRWLELRGVRSGLANTTDVLANVSGGAERDVGVSNLLEAFVDLDLDRIVGWRGGSLSTLVAATHGPDARDDVGSIHAPSNLAAEDGFRLLELWYEQRLWSDRIAVLVGIYAVDSEFDAKDTADIFVNSAFGTGLDLSETGVNGPSIFPLSSLGGRLMFQPLPGLELRVAVVDGVPGARDDPSAIAVDLDDDDGILVISEMEFSLPDADFARLGAGGWHYTADFEPVAGGANRGSSGLYGFFEGVLWNEDDPSQGLSGFVRLGYADDRTNVLSGYGAAGLVYTGLFPGRGSDVVGLGALVGLAAGTFQEAEAGSGRVVADYEGVAELTYRAQLTPQLGVQPVFQYTANPGLGAAADSLLVGLRVAVGI